MAKKVLLVLNRSPLNSVKASEGLRQGLGLTLADNEVTVLLLDAAAWLAVPLSPQMVGGGDTKKHLDTLLLVKGKVEVEAESLARFGITGEALIPGVAVVSQAEAIAEMTAAEAMIVF